jgi:hypothetical protein
VKFLMSSIQPMVGHCYEWATNAVL